MKNHIPTIGSDKAFLVLVLHTHLPYVRHPEHEEFLEEDWLFEVITEAYLPLLRIFQRLVDDGVDFRLTMSLTPTLGTMLLDQLLQERYLGHIKKLIAFAEREIIRTEGTVFYESALQNLTFFEAALNDFDEVHDRNLVKAFRKFQDLGKIEFIASAATHAYLPLVQNEKAVLAQVITGVEFHEKHLGKRPEGMWLPECGYYEGLDRVLAEAGIRYFFTEFHAILQALPRPHYGVYAPVRCPSGTIAFGRDMDSSKQVWSSREGYPGNAVYRDFFRDAGFDLDYDYIRPYLHPDGLRVNLGVKYHRITGYSEVKEPYTRTPAIEKAAQHAEHFRWSREQQAEALSRLFPRGKLPVMVAPFDTELFGHWWYEGPEWLDFTIRTISRATNGIRMITPGEYLGLFPECFEARPASSSWGDGGHSAVWLDPANDWMYRHLHKAAERMSILARTFADASGVRKEAIDQAMRELLLAQSSDWAFIMKNGGHVEYATKRFKGHIENFTRLYEEIMLNQVDEKRLRDTQCRHLIFPEIRYHLYA